MHNLISTVEAAKRLGICPQTLRVWRCRGDGPPFVRLGSNLGRARYSITDIEKWIAARTYASTAAEAAEDFGAGASA